jgi:hypothetical protein
MPGMNAFSSPNRHPQFPLLARTHVHGIPMTFVTLGYPATAPGGN